MDDRTDSGALPLRVTDLEQWRRREPGRCVVPPCPPWCILPADHDLANPLARDYDGSVVRMHVAFRWVAPWIPNKAGLEVEVVQTVQVGGKADVADEEPSVLISGDSAITMTTAGAEKLASVLVDAAAVLKCIEAAA